jgi:hypothetical protein
VLQRSASCSELLLERKGKARPKCTANQSVFANEATDGDLNANGLHAPINNPDNYRILWVQMNAVSSHACRHGNVDTCSIESS